MCKPVYFATTSTAAVIVSRTTLIGGLHTQSFLTDPRVSINVPPNRFDVLTVDFGQ